MQNTAIITPVLAAGSTTSPYIYLTSLMQSLHCSVRKGATPVFAPTYSLVGFSHIDASIYVAVVNVQGLISYRPCGSGSDYIKTQMVNQNFSIPFVRNTAPTSVAIHQGETVNEVRNGRTFVSETPIYLSID